MCEGKLATMLLRFLMISYSLITGYSYEFDKTEPYIIRPKFIEDSCKIGEAACSNHLRRLQQHVIHQLNSQRYNISYSLAEFKNVPRATNMLYLEGDSELINEAQAFAETCFQKSTVQGCAVQGETKQDGNVLIYAQIHPTDTLYDAGERIDEAMRSDISKFPIEYISQFVEYYDHTLPGDEIQNFAKIAHARVWKVGCGLADFVSSKIRFKEVVVCFFGPPKLKNGEELYKSGSGPCADCPKGTACVTEGEFSGGLCKVKEGSIPGIAKSLTPQTTNSAEDITLWKCDLNRYSDGCSVERRCSPNWILYPKGGFKYIVVSGSCVTVSVFKEKIHIEQPSCFRFQYMKSGDLLLQTEVIAFASPANGHPAYSRSVGADASEWSEATLDIPSRGEPVQVGIVVRSHPSSDGEQIIKVKDFEVFSGRC